MVVVVVVLEVVVVEVMVLVVVEVFVVEEVVVEVTLVDEVVVEVTSVAQACQRMSHQPLNGASVTTYPAYSIQPTNLSTIP